jgi:eukaryotic-like serine/threonine-protein kinase
VSVIDDRAVERLRDLLAQPDTGDVLADRYELGERIGEGGMGIVFAARDRRDGSDVAVKIVRACGDHDEARFEREARALEGVSHPAVVPHRAHAVHAGVRFLVMDRVVGSTLAERLGRGALAVGETVTLAKRLAEGLSAVHRAGLVHRDVKPSNVLLEGDDPARACLLDFGLARPTSSDALTAQGALVGTPGYMAPEQVRAESPAGPAADIFALGCVVHECLTGRPPFAADDTEALFARVLACEPRSLREIRPAVPLALEALAGKMLAKDPSARPSAEEVVRELALASASADDGGDLSPGVVLGGKYRIEGHLGEGGMGVVFSAQHLELGTKVAIKVLRRGVGDEARFLREAKAAARLESEHVARVLDVGRAPDGTPYIVMEHLRGADLGRQLARSGRLEVARAVDHLLEACVAIAEAHQLGIVHRDIKPSNLFVVARRDGSEMVKVLDFGISKLTRALDGESSVTVTTTGESAVLGSIAYMSPEQLRASSKVEARSDVWSLGVVLHELVTGRRPFQGDNAAAVAAAIAASEPRRLREERPDLPGALEAVVLRCLAKEPRERFPDVASLARALSPFAGPAGRRAVAGITGTASGPSTQAEGALRRGRPRVAVAVAAATAGALFAAALIVRGSPDVAPSPTAEVPPSPTEVAPVAEPPPPLAERAEPEPERPAPQPTSRPRPPAAEEGAAAAPARARVPARRAPAPSASATVSAPSAPSEIDLRDPALEGR